MWIIIIIIMMASVVVGDGCSGSFLVQNGVCQGCVIAPLLFVLYFCVVVDY